VAIGASAPVFFSPYMRAIFWVKQEPYFNWTSVMGRDFSLNFVILWKIWQFFPKKKKITRISTRKIIYFPNFVCQKKIKFFRIKKITAHGDYMANHCF
jgi:hypothetical protein